MELNLEKVRDNAREASTDDLLDRVTVYRSGMEPEALEVIEAELARRHVTDEQIRAHGESKRGVSLDENGLARRCTYCDRPAVGEGWRWHRLWKLIPLFPRRVRFCEQHAR
jgi:hypothetical protein